MMFNFHCLLSLFMAIVISGSLLPRHGLAYQPLEPMASLEQVDTQPFALVLGTAQDGGYPQAGCKRACCQAAWNEPHRRCHVVSLAIIDPESNHRWLMECTPDFREQWRMLEELTPTMKNPLDGIFITHAHVGHYAGLIHLGREVIGAKAIPVYVMPRMKRFLESNGPWSQLVSLKNIEVRELQEATPQHLTERITIQPLLVPHRDEYSETVAFVVAGPNRRLLFLPDIDKWERWDTPIERLLQEVDVAYLDATFLDEKELPGRNLAEIPHPLVRESIQRFATLPAEVRAKVRFIHFNHTNPLINARSPEAEEVRRLGFGVAVQGERTPL